MSKLFVTLLSIMAVMVNSQSFFSVLNPAQLVTPCASDAIGNAVRSSAIIDV